MQTTRGSSVNENHAKAVEMKHQAIKARIEELLKNPVANDFEIKQLKKEKLRLKEEREKIADTVH